MKKISFLFTLMLITSVLFAETVKIDGLYYSLGATTAQLVSDQSSDKSVYSAYTSVTIPASITYSNYTYPVTSIGTSAFEGLTNLQSVTLPASITTIGTDAFYGCTKLGDVNLPEGLTNINLRAFYNCNLDTIVIPSTVTTIGNSAFRSNPLTSVVWNPVTCSVGTGEDAPFYNVNSQIKSFTIGESATTVPAYLCYQMTQLDTVVLPPSVKSLGEHAFFGCKALKSINLPKTQKTLPVSFLEGCTSLETIELPATLTTISADAFYGCSSLKEVNLPEGLTTINLRAFWGCKLSSVTIPSTVTTIGNSAFRSNPLTSVVWNPVTCSIGTGEYAPFYSDNSQIKSFTIGESATTVPAYLCYQMTQLDTVVLPPSVKSLGEHAFFGCKALKSINLPKTQKTLPVSFLEGCTSLETIELPATLTTISADAFYGCSSLKEVNLPEGLTTINLRAFWGCKLSSVTIPSTVTTIGNSAFRSNPLTSVVWNPVTCSIGTGEYAPFYSDNSQITSFTFGDSVQVIPGYLCQAMNVLDSVVLPPTVTSIGNDAFYGCAQLKDIVLPASVQAISQRAFMYCSSFKKITLPKGLKTIATSLFEGCSYLEQVVIPSSVTTINQDAFYNCQSLNAIYNYATTPQTIVERTVYNVNKNTCVLYVPMDYIDLYKAKAVWCDFLNIVGMATEMTFEDKQVQVNYYKQDSTLYYMEVQNWQVPKEPRIQGFNFVGWQIQSGYLADGIVLRAVYEANAGTDAPTVYTNPANPAQKLIREGNVYILSDDRLYTIQGQPIQ